MWQLGWHQESCSSRMASSFTSRASSNLFKLKRLLEEHLEDLARLIIMEKWQNAYGIQGRNAPSC
jgi:hypothetical protein